MKQMSEAIASKYKISSWWVYQIWRGAHPLIDPKDIKLLSEEPDSLQQADPVECNIISGSKAKKTGGKKTKSKSVRISEAPPTQNKLPPISSEHLNMSKEDLDKFYEKEAGDDKKIQADMRRM